MLNSKDDDLDGVAIEIRWILDDLASIREALRILNPMLTLEAERRRQVARRGQLLARLDDRIDRYKVLACQP